MNQLADAVRPRSKKPKTSVWIPPTSANHKIRMRMAIIRKMMFKKAHMPWLIPDPGEEGQRKGPGSCTDVATDVAARI